MKMKFSELCEDDEIMYVEYDVIPGEKYGIAGKYVHGGRYGIEKTRGLFLTEDEAVQWCRFMVENKILPSALNQVIRDEFYIEIIPKF